MQGLQAMSRPCESLQSCHAEPSSLRSDTTLKIPSHVRQYLQKLEAYTRDRKRISELEIQIVVLRALGE